MDVTESWDGTERTTPGGGPFNTARALSRLGVPTAFLGRLSTDDPGRELARLLSDDGVDLSLVSVGPEPTTVARASVTKDGSATYRFSTDGTSAPNLTPDMLPATLGPDVTAIHVGTLGLVLEPISSTVMELLAREGARRRVMVDPNIRPDAIANASASHARLIAAIGLSTVVKASEDDVAWLGAMGMTAAGQVEVKAQAVEVVDTIGAGDAFGAALLAWLEEHCPIQGDLRLEATELASALTFACRAASLSCTRAGAEAPYRADLDKPLRC